MQPNFSYFTNKKWSLILVIVQFACLSYMIVFENIVSDTLFLLYMQLLGIIIGVWALLQMGLLNFSVFPEVKSKSCFIRSGPYRYIRYPMYLAVLLVFFPTVISHYSIFFLIIFAILMLVLFIKINLEEKYMSDAFPEFKNYQKHTDKFIPFIW